MMNIRVFATCLIVVLVLIVLIISAFILTIGFAPFPYTRQNRRFDRELNEAMIYLVETAISVQYSTHSAEKLQEILTEELFEKEVTYLFRGYVFENVSHYYVNRDYMRTMRYSGDNQWSVVVGMHEGGLMSGYSFFLHVTIIKTESGSYRISFIGADA